jgi:hypothetical protein
LSLKQLVIIFPENKLILAGKTPEDGSIQPILTGVIGLGAMFKVSSLWKRCPFPFLLKTDWLARKPYNTVFYFLSIAILKL